MDRRSTCSKISVISAILHLIDKWKRDCYGNYGYRALAAVTSSEKHNCHLDGNHSYTVIFQTVL